MNKKLTFGEFKKEINSINVEDNIEINFVLGEAKLSFDKYTKLQYGGALMPGILNNGKEEIKIDFNLIFTEK